MRGAPLALVMILTGVLAGGCTRACKSGTVFVTLHFDSASAAGDMVAVTVSLAGANPRTHNVAHTKGAPTSTVEIDFSAGYPSGKEVDVTVESLDGSTSVGAGQGSVTASGSCRTLSIAVAGAGTDMSMPDDLTTMTDDLGLSSDLAQLSDLAGCHEVFVSTAGDDGNSGCTPATPKKTIASGMSVATATDVLVCKGTYPEAVALTRAIGLRGGYSCTTWSRTATFGYPTFDGVNETVITGQSAGFATVGVGAAAQLEGFTVQGPTGVAMPSTAVLVNVSGATITGNKIVAGSSGGTVASNGSVGVDIEAAGDEIVHNSINGGSGISGLNATPSSPTTSGSIGVLINGASHVHANLINPGSGQIAQTTHAGTAAGASGIWVTGGNVSLANGTAIEGNSISGGNGTAQSSVSPGQLIGALGIRVANTDGNPVDIVGNVIDAGSGTVVISGGVNSHPDTIGVELSNVATGAISLQGNRIFGGLGTGPSAAPNNTDQADGVLAFASASSVLTIVDNEIQSGSSSTGSVSGIRLEVQLAATVAHNTVVSGRATGESIGLLIFNPNVANQVINNLFLGETNSFAIGTAGCLGAGYIAAWQNNASAYTNVLLEDLDSNAGCTALSTYSTIDAVTAAFALECTGATACHNFNSDAGPLVGGNINLASSCSGDSGCVVLAGCTSPLSSSGDAGPCARGMFAAFDSASDGVAALESAGWNLTTGAPCAVSQGGLDDHATITTDWQGTARTAPVSIGASEFDGTCN